MDVERSTLCNCVVNFLLEENYLLTAFELLHELLDDGKDALAIRLRDFFADPSRFPPDQISRFNSLRVADPQTLREEKEGLEEKLAICEYELRLAKEDVTKLTAELQKKSESANESSVLNPESINHGSDVQQRKKDSSFSSLGPLNDNERCDLNCAVKEYLLLAGYRLTAMTFYEEVTEQNLDVWHETPACVPDALRHYYYQYLSSTSEAAQEKFSMLRQIESLQNEKETLSKSRATTDNQINVLTRSLEAVQRDLKDRENQVQSLKQSLEQKRQELNDCRAEITSLKVHIEGSLAGRDLTSADSDISLSQSLQKYEQEIKTLHLEIEALKSTNATPNAPVSVDSKFDVENEENVVEIHEDKPIPSSLTVPERTELADSPPETSLEDTSMLPEVIDDLLVHSSKVGNGSGGINIDGQENSQAFRENGEVQEECVNLKNDTILEKMGLETIQILADALPKIVPYVLINHREELLPLIMCAIERHPDSSTRDSLTHTLFNLIKRPDEQQRRIIMDACVSLAENVGEMRTETELLPQCWEQINHIYEERRLLVAQSCGELAKFVRPEIRDSLILSIVQQLVEDSATIVREAAAHNLALLLPLFPNVDKYFKVEEVMFQLACDPSSLVVETTLKELVPAVVLWGNQLDHVLRVLLSHMISSAQRCPPLSGVESSLESHLHVLGERERWNIDVLLRMLMDILPFVHQKTIQTCPFSSDSAVNPTLISAELLELYSREQVDWPSFEWMHVECFPDLIHLMSLLPQKEDGLRNRATKFLLAVSQMYGDLYLTHITLPLFMVAVGDNADMKYFPPSVHPKIQGLKPRTVVAERIAVMCVLPLLLAGVLGVPTKHEQLAEYLRRLLVKGTEEGQARNSQEIFHAVRFLCTFEEHHAMIFNVVWEMVVSTSISMKVNAANLLKAVVPYIDARVASTHVLPALITLGSDQNLSVKYTSIEAFGAVAQHFKNDMIVDKIRVQMDAFLDDGSNEATIAVVRALGAAVPHTTDKLRDYLLSKIFQFTSSPAPTNDVLRRRERVNAFCESIRALDATDLSANSVRDFLLPAIQNMLKDSDAIDPAHKEALEIILRERSGGTFEAISKVMGAHIGFPTSVTNFFGEGGILGKKETADIPVQEQLPDSPKPVIPQPPVEDTRFRRIMRGNFTEMLRGKPKGPDDQAP
ncbi:hypothetical protein MLD38_040693 [Melastoma candidum]|nr:hypothetical protein MLD38_040693 [Melastoma candidum]